jgi:hypothetical protein
MEDIMNYHKCNRYTIKSAGEGVYRVFSGNAQFGHDFHTIHQAKMFVFMHTGVVPTVWRTADDTSN